MSLSELKDSSWAKTVFQISPVGDATVCKEWCENGAETGYIGGEEPR
jgi:hypothetical protein